MSVRQLRVVVTADDYDEALRFYSRLEAPAGLQLTLFEEPTDGSPEQITA